MRALRYPLTGGFPPEIARTRDIHTFLDQYALEHIRHALRRELRVHSGQLALAREIGIARGSLRKFIDMQSTPRPANMDRLREWASDRPEVWTPIGAVCLATLVLDLVPAEARAPARRHLARELAVFYARAGQPVPAWLAAEE